MQTIHVPDLYLSAPRLLLKNASTAGVVPFETLTTRLLSKMSQLTPSSRTRPIGMRRLWQRQSQFSLEKDWRDIGVPLSSEPKRTLKSVRANLSTLGTQAAGGKAIAVQANVANKTEIERLFAESKTRRPPEAKEVIESKIIPCERPAETQWPIVARDSYDL